MKCNQSGPGFELVSPCPYPATITITPRAPHIIPCRGFSVSLEQRRLILMVICCYPYAQNTSWSLPTPTLKTNKFTRTPGYTQDQDTGTSSTRSTRIFEYKIDERSQLKYWSSYYQVHYQITREAENEERQNAIKGACNQLDQDQQSKGWLAGLTKW